eukprot:CAMPEP_0175408638 /NCGR_PEP_ID=MMETSP0095-20121207/40694_1 /TAXON_ID=311494 /ORGANISM="Alexandrium monilatum, Strain CCMP3105" /LENGTH=252 /DNA_ID=CAMNT_0016707559 /DNA_START=42 /DNA_END=798 /DNA_ORIENTATION=+
MHTSGVPTPLLPVQLASIAPSAQQQQVDLRGAAMGRLPALSPARRLPDVLLRPGDVGGAHGELRGPELLLAEPVHPRCGRRTHGVPEALVRPVPRAHVLEPVEHHGAVGLVRPAGVGLVKPRNGLAIARRKGGTDVALRPHHDVVLQGPQRLPSVEGASGGGPRGSARVVGAPLRRSCPAGTCGIAELLECPRPAELVPQVALPQRRQGLDVPPVAGLSSARGRGSRSVLSVDSAEQDIDLEEASAMARPAA